MPPLWMEGTVQSLQQQRVKFQELQPAQHTQMSTAILNLVTVTYPRFASNANELLNGILKWCLGYTGESQT